MVNVGKGVASAVTDPEATAKGIGGGVKKMGVNIGRRTKRAVDGATSDAPKPEGESGAGNAAAERRQVGRRHQRRDAQVGEAGRRRSLHDQPVLSGALEHIATLDVAGGIAAKVAVPIPGVIGATGDVGDLVWGADPEQVRKTNEQRAREIGASPEGAKAFFLNGVLTLTMQTRLIAALHAVKVPGVGDYLASAAEAADEREALFFVESAEMLMAEHKAAPVASVLTDSRAILAKRASGEGVLLLPIDWLRQSASATAQAKELASRAKAELGATSLRLKLTGRTSDAAARELAALGWKR